MGTYVPLNAVYNATIALKPDASYELQKRNHRQAMRRALGRLHAQGFVYAVALAWVSVDDQSFHDWQGGGSRKREPGDANPRGYPVARWKRVTLSTNGIALAQLLEAETTQEDE